MALSDEVPHHICQSSYTSISIFLHVIWTPICNYKIMRIFLYYIKKKKKNESMCMWRCMNLHSDACTSTLLAQVCRGYLHSFYEL